MVHKNKRTLYSKRSNKRSNKQTFKRSNKRSFKQTFKQSNKRSFKRQNTRRNTRRHKGGNYKELMVNTFEGIPYKDDAVVDVAGFGTMSIKEYIDYINNKDLQPHP